jgi:hypothetical protein
MTTHVSAPRTRSVSPDGVPVGLLTQTGLGTSLLMFIGAIIDLIVGDTFDADTRSLLAAGIATAVATILARGYQAGQLYAKQHGIELPDQPLR